MSNAPTIAVVLNFRAPAETITAVSSLRSSAHRLDGIVVVDNASGDGSVEQFRRTLPDVFLLETERNGGFSAGCNCGIREALARGAKRVLLLNSDATVDPDTLGKLEAVLDARPEVGIVGPALMRAGRHGTVESLGMSFGALSGRMRHHAFGLTSTAGGFPAPVVVDGISGCAMLIRREVFEQSGLFWEDYFFGFEDLDFCLRARRSGFATVVSGEARVHHQGSVSIGRTSPRRIYFAARNHLLLAARVSGSQSITARALQHASIIGLNLAHALKGTDVPRLTGVVAVARGVRDYYRGRFGPGTSTG